VARFLQCKTVPPPVGPLANWLSITVYSRTVSDIFTTEQRAKAKRLLESRSSLGNNAACKRFLGQAFGTHHLYQNILLELLGADALIDTLYVRLENPLSDSLERERHPTGTV
jgi:hypothetical protein